jgi:hypothetical protein
LSTFYGVFGLVGKLMNFRIDIDRETLVLHKIYELEFKLKIFEIDHFCAKFSPL